MSLFYTNVVTGQTLPFALSDVRKTAPPQHLLRSNLAELSAAPVAAGRRDVRPNGADGFTFVPALVSTGIGLTNSYQVVPTGALRRLEQEQDEARVPIPLRGKASAYGNVVQTPNLIPVWEQRSHPQKYRPSAEEERSDFDTEVFVGSNGPTSALAQTRAAAPSAAPKTMPGIRDEHAWVSETYEEPRALPANAYFGVLNFTEDGMPYCHGLRRDAIYKHSSPVELF